MPVAHVLETLLILLLGTASVAAVGLAMEAASERLRPRRFAATTLGKRLRSGSRKAPAPANLNPVELLLWRACQQSPAAKDRAVDDLVEDHDAGMLRWCGLLTKAAPLLGLAATLLGVSCSLEEFVQHPGQPQSFVHGFAVAILGTLWGVFVSLVSLATARWFRLPTLARYRQEVLTLLPVRSKRRRTPPIARVISLLPFPEGTQHAITP